MRIYNTIFFTNNPDKDTISRLGELPVEGDDFKILLTEFEASKIQGKNIAISTNESERAKFAAELIYACHFVSIAEQSMTGDLYGEDLIINEIPKVGQRQFYTPNLILDCYAAGKASYSQNIIYAINKFKLSINTSSCLSVDLNPGEHLDWNSSEDKVRFAYFIILAYSVLEELGLEIRASKENPSKFDNGEWNPIVRQNLEERLIEANVPLNETVIWYERGESQTKKKSPKEKEFMNYSSGIFIRDKKVEIINAISQLSYLRSSISAHKFGRKIKELNIYDVKSAQYLAQLLLLYKLELILPPTMHTCP